MATKFIAEHILDVTEQLILDSSVASFSMREVTTASGCSSATIYRHFANKDDLLMSIYNRQMERYFQAEKLLTNSKMTELERLLVTIFLNSYDYGLSSQPFKGLGLNFLSSNEGMCRCAPEETKQRLDELTSKVFTSFLNAISNLPWAEQLDQELTHRLFTQLMIISRGSAIVIANKNYQENYDERSIIMAIDMAIAQIKAAFSLEELPVQPRNVLNGLRMVYDNVQTD